jgi:hypothetical protein
MSEAIGGRADEGRKSSEQSADFIMSLLIQLKHVYHTVSVTQYLHTPFPHSTRLPTPKLHSFQQTDVHSCSCVRYVQEAGQTQQVTAAGTRKAAGDAGAAGNSFPTVGQGIHNHIKWQPYLLASGEQCNHFVPEIKQHIAWSFRFTNHAIAYSYLLLCAFQVLA